MLGYTLLILFASFILGVAVNGHLLYITALAFGWLVIMAIAWVWLVATGQTGFFNRRT